MLLIGGGMTGEFEVEHWKAASKLDVISTIISFNSRNASSMSDKSFSKSGVNVEVSEDSSG